jgi:hypothetical protein
MDLLAAADKANNHSPFRMAIHARNQEFGLGMGERRLILFSPHEARSLSQVPRALRLIKDHNVFRWSARMVQGIVAKVMNVLNESFNALTNFPLPHSIAKTPLTCNLVTGKCFTEHSDKRTVSRQKDRMCRLVYFSTPSGNVKPNQSFSCSRDTGDKANDFAPLRSRFVHQFFNAREVTRRFSAPAS